MKIKFIFSHIFCLLLGLGLLWGCADLNNPSSTILAIPYQQPEITSVTTSSNFFSIAVRSYLRKTGDFEGYIIYLSEDVAIIDGLGQSSLNDFDNIRDKTGYFTNIGLSNGRLEIGSKDQTGFLSDIMINSTNQLYLAVSVYGQNDTFARINSHGGYIESPPTRLNPFHLKQTFNFSLSNFVNNSSNSSLGYNNGRLFVTNSTNQSTSLLSTILTNNGNSDDYLIFQVGTASIQSLGYRTNFDLLTILPTNGYTTSTVPIISNHIYAVKNGEQYFKLYVTNAFLDVGLNTFLVVEGEAAFVNVANAIHF